MSTSAVKTDARAVDVAYSETHLYATLADGRVIAIPLSLHPSLRAGSPADRATWQLIGGGAGIHWPTLDEDLSVEGLLEGR